MLGWMSGVASSTYISGTMLQALVQFVDANYQPQLWQGVLFTYAVVIICGIVTIGFARALPAIETILLTVYALGFFAIIVPMVYLAPQKASAQTVFLYFINGGGWPVQGLSFLVGLQGWAFSALGRLSIRCLQVIQLMSDRCRFNCSCEPSVPRFIPPNR